MEQIYLFSLPVKEYQIVEYFLQSSLKDEVMKIMPVQKQTRAGQRTRFKVGVKLAKSSPGRLSWCHLQALCPHWNENILLPQAFVVVGDHNGHVGLGVKCAKEVSYRCLSSQQLLRKQLSPCPLLPPAEARLLRTGQTSAVCVWTGCNSHSGCYHFGQDVPCAHQAWLLG